MASKTLLTLREKKSLAALAGVAVISPFFYLNVLSLVDRYMSPGDTFVFVPHKHLKVVAEKEQTRIFSDPIRLIIPSLLINASVESVGLDEKGVMKMTEDPNNVEWLNISSRPEEDGNVVIAGHYGWKGSTPAVFDTLYKIQKDDIVYVEDSSGAITPFVVRKTERYYPDSFAKDVFSSGDSGTHLSLVTCEGSWNKKTGSYSERLVVFADKE